MKKEEEKKIPTGSMIYLLHTHFNGETYSFIGNKQTFGDERTTRTHFENLAYMFLPPVGDTNPGDYVAEYCLKQLQVYPGVLNVGHSDQRYLNDEKREFIKEYRQIEFLNNIKLNDDSSWIAEFMAYNRRKKKEISHWEKDVGTLYNICELAEWLEDKDVSLINTLPRFFWFDDEYKQTIEELGVMPETFEQLMCLMNYKDNLADEEFLIRLKRFSLYMKSEDAEVIEKLKNWQIGKHHKSWKSYSDSLKYASSYMYVFCKHNHYDNEYKIEKNNDFIC